MNEAQQQIVDGVERNGWFAVNYVPRPGTDDAKEWFTYTVGLTKTAGWPEIICFGLDSDRSLHLLREAIAECWTRRIAPAHGIQLTQVLDGLPARLQRVTLGPPYFAMADWYAEHSGTDRSPERLQLFWPDRNGRFPTDPGCDPSVRDRQISKAAR